MSTCAAIAALTQPTLVDNPKQLHGIHHITTQCIASHVFGFVQVCEQFALVELCDLLAGRPACRAQAYGAGHVVVVKHEALCHLVCLQVIPF